MASSLLRALALRFAALTLVGPVGRFVVGVLMNWRPNPPSSSCLKDGLKVIACGFPRSGTFSLQKALNILGFNCYHGIHFYCADSGSDVWTGHPMLWLRAATEANWNEWEKLLGGFDAIVDTPATFFYKQLMAAYPNAKVILNVRDPDDWHRSCMQTLWYLRNKLFFQVFHSQTYLKLVDATMWEGKFEGRFPEKDFATQVYRRHVEEVKRLVPAEKLLVHEAKDGWAPLCKFLQVKVPETQYPTFNDAASFRRFVEGRERAFGMFSVVYVGIMSWAFVMCFRLISSSVLTGLSI